MSNGDFKYSINRPRLQHNFHHLILGGQLILTNGNAKNWITPSESVADIEQGKDRAAAHARVYLRKAANLELPLTWK